MLNLIISFDDPMERLLYGEPDPCLSLWECKHYDAGFPEHTHNDGDGNGDYGIGRPTRPIDLGEEPGTDFVDPSDYNPAPDSDAFNEWRQQQREAADALVQEYEAYADVWRDHREQYQDHPTALLKIDDCPECRRRLDAFQDAYREIVEEEPTADAEADLDRYESVLESPRGRNALLRTKRGLEAWIRYQGERRGLTERAIQAQIAGLRAGDEAAVLQRPGGRNALAEGVTAGPAGPEYLQGFGAVGEVGADAAQGLGDRAVAAQAGAAQQEAWIRYQAQQQGLTAEQTEAQVEAWRSQRPDDTTLDRPGPDGPEYLRGFGAVTDDPSAAAGRISPAGGSDEMLGTAEGGQDARAAGVAGFGEVGADAVQGAGDRIGQAQQEAWIRYQAQQQGLTAEQTEAQVEAWRSQRPDDTTLDRPGPDGPEYLRGFGAVTDDPSAAAGRISPAGGSDEMLGTAEGGQDARAAGLDGFEEVGADAAQGLGDRAVAAQQEAWIRYQAQQKGLTAEQTEAEVEAWRSQRPDDTTLDRRGPDGPEYLQGFGAVGVDAAGRISPAGGSDEVLHGIGPAEAVAEFGGEDREAWIRFQGERKGWSEAAIAAAIEASPDGGEYVGRPGREVDLREPGSTPEVGRVVEMPHGGDAVVGGRGDDLTAGDRDAWIRFQGERKGLSEEAIAEAIATGVTGGDLTTLVRILGTDGPGEVVGGGTALDALTDGERKVVDEAQAQGLLPEAITQKLDEYRNSPGGVLDAVDYIVNVGDAGSLTALTAIADDADKGSIRITVKDDEGNPRSMTLGEYISQDLIPQVEERVAINTVNDEIDEITRELAAEDVGALEAIANDPDRADLPVTVYAKDENGDRIPSAGADGQPATDADGNPIYETKTITMAEHIRENILPGVGERVAINTVNGEIDDILRELDPGDATALEAIANDPDRANLSVSIYATNEEGERIPVVGEDGEPVTDADGNVIHETKTVTVAEYIRDTIMPYAEQRAAQQESQAQTEVALGEIQSLVQGGIESYEINRLRSIANDPATSGLKISITGADGNAQATTIGEYLKQTVEAYDNRQIGDLERIRNDHAKARDDWNNEAVEGLTRNGEYGMAQGYVSEIKDLEMRRLAQEKLDAAREAGVEKAAIATRIKNAQEAYDSARHEWQKRRARKEIRDASYGYRDFMNNHGYNRRSFEIAYSNLIAKAQGYELNPTNQAMYAAQQRAWGSGQAYTLPSSQGFRDSKENFDLQTAGGDAALQAHGAATVVSQATATATPEIMVPTSQLDADLSGLGRGVSESAVAENANRLRPPTGLEAEEIGDLAQAQAESRIITAYQAERYGDPSLAGQMRVEGRASDGSVKTGVAGTEFVEQARSYGLTPDQLFQGYVDDAESGPDGVEGVGQSQPTRAEAERFYDEVVSAYDIPDVVDDEGFSTNVNAHQHTRVTLEQLKSRYANDPAKTAFLDSAIHQLDVDYSLHSLGADARAGKGLVVLAEQERRLKAQAVKLGKVGTLEDIAQGSGLAGTTEYRVWLADEKKYATLTGQEMQEMGVSNVLHDPWSQEARDLAAQGQNVLVERAVKPAAAEVKDDPGKAAAMANFAQHMLQFAAADSGGASTVVAMQKSAEELAKESPAFAALPEAEQRKLLDHYDNPVKNPYTRAAVLAAASGMAGSAASGTAFGSSLVGQAALGVPFAAADVGGAYLDTGQVTGKDVGRALFWESLPFIPDVGSAAFKGGRHGVRSFATGGDFTDWAFGNVDSTLRIDLKDLSKSIPEGFTPQGGSIADNAVFAYGFTRRAQTQDGHRNPTGIRPIGAGATV